MIENVLMSLSLKPSQSYIGEGLLTKRYTRYGEHSATLTDNI